MAGRWLLADPDSLLRWAWHALSPRRTRDGRPSHALHGLVATLLRAMEQTRPVRALAVWEPEGATWRHELWSAYQAQREPEPEELVQQRAWAKEWIAALGWPQLTVPGCAARDVLATLAAAAEGDEVLLLSADRDLCQCVGSGCALVVPRPADLETFDEAAVAARYGVSPAQFPALRALIGDAGNGLPGVPGIGEKTAAEWLRRWGSLEALLSADLSGKRGAETKAHADQLRAVAPLVAVRRDVPVEQPAGGWPRPAPQADRLGALLAGWDFHDLARRLTPRLLAPPGEISYRLARGAEAVAQVVAAAERGRVVGLAAGARGVAVSPARADAWYVAREEAGPLLAALAEGRVRLVAHDLLRAADWLAPALPAAVGDSHLALWLLDPDRPTPGVVEAGRRWLGLTAETPDDLPREAAALCLEADWTRRLEPSLRAELEARRMAGAYRERELPVVRAVAALAAAGLPTERGSEALTVRRTTGSAGRFEVVRPAADAALAELRATPGECLLAARYVDPALWLVAGLSGDRDLAAALRAGQEAGESAAASTAAALWERLPSAVSAEQRARAAALNGAAARGGDTAWLQRRLGLPAAEAAALWRAWEARFPGVAAWRRDVAARARREGWLTTLGGRRLRAGSSDGVVLARTMVEAALGDLLGRALLACRGRAVLPLRLGWVVRVRAEEAGAAAAALIAGWARQADLGLSQPVVVEPLADSLAAG